MKHKWNSICHTDWLIEPVRGTDARPHPHPHSHLFLLFILIILSLTGEKKGNLADNSFFIRCHKSTLDSSDWRIIAIYLSFCLCFSLFLLSLLLSLWLVPFDSIPTSLMHLLLVILASLVKFMHIQLDCNWHQQPTQHTIQHNNYSRSHGILWHHNHHHHTGTIIFTIHLKCTALFHHGNDRNWS